MKMTLNYDDVFSRAEQNGYFPSSPFRSFVRFFSVDIENEKESNFRSLFFTYHLPMYNAMESFSYSLILAQITRIASSFSLWLTVGKAHAAKIPSWLIE